MPPPESSVTQPSYTDPTYRISKLAAANNQPTFVRPDTPIKEVVTLMLSRDFSQIPVMTSEREVKGIVSWMSVGSRLSLGIHGESARELMDTPHQEIRANASLFQAIPIIIQSQYVLVRGPDDRITGIVTSSDLSLQFQQRTEPFLLLGDIENHIRSIIGTKFSKEELMSARDPADTERTVDGVHNLVFGEYIRLLESRDRWAQLKFAIDRVTFCKELDGVRRIRNDVMHFDPDGVPPEDLDRLRKFADFLYKLQNIGVT
jgi:CBS domain-containing protein